ncbi:MAG: tetratricopeptide repeat protein [Thermodesulfobacteriota bacterium]
MAFGWFSGKKDPAGKALEKADRLAGQGRWAEALSYYEEARDAASGSEPARNGVRACREQLVAFNLSEAAAYETAGDPGKAREHAALALDLAAGEAALASRARQVLDRLEGPGAASAASPAAPGRLFPPSCGCSAPCGPGEAAEGEGEAPVEDLYGFYLEALSPEERDAFEALEGEGDFPEGFVLLQQGETRLARPLLEAARSAYPTQPGPHYALGLLAALEKDPEAAGRYFAQALEVGPGFSPAAHHRADVLRESGSPAEGAAFLRRWLQGHPDDGEAWVLLAACSLEAGDPAACLEASEEGARRMPPADPRANLLKARALRRLGRPDQALGALQAVAARRPDLLEALVPIGDILLEKGGASAERAAEVFKRCYRLDPERGWVYRLRLAQAYAARGWPAEAKDMLAEARAELPDAPEARERWEEVRRILEGSAAKGP